MIKKRILNPGRVRQIAGGFSYIPHRFLTGGFLASLEQKEILLYLFFAWSIVIAFLLFRRSLRRKLLFGRRPDILSGLPMMLLITALLLMILTGFGAIPQNILTHFHLIT